MKAITCTQCGATIENVSERSVIVDCEYCGARILMEQTKVQAPKPTPVSAPSFELEATPPTKVNFVAIAGGFVVAIFILIVASIVITKPKTSAETKTYPVITYSTPSPSYSWTAPPVLEESKPVPVVNYQPRVSWDGPNDMEYFADPEVDISSVSHLTSEEVKKTVFKNRIVKLRVVINTEGEIDEVETVSGHPVLVEAATGSAKRSIFKSRSKPTTRILTYTFRVLKD